MTSSHRALLMGALLLSSGCRGRDETPAETAPSTALSTDSLRQDSLSRARQDSINRAQPGYVVDSILPIEEELRRFRAALPGDSATRLEGGSPSRDALVRRFVTALSGNDTIDLKRMVMRGREFADLYYPESPYTHPPYRQSPALAWSLIQNPSASGLTRLLRRVGGHRLTYVGHRCDPKVLKEGRNTRYAGCLVDLIEENGRHATRRYFGSIVERDGVFKFMSYTNQL